MSLLNRFFKKGKKPRLSKLEFWAKFELYDLIQDLKVSFQILDQINDPTNLILKEFIEDFEEELFNVSHDNFPDFTQIWEWFEPAGKWNIMVKNDYEELRKRVYFRADRWKRNKDEENKK